MDKTKRNANYADWIIFNCMVMCLKEKNERTNVRARKTDQEYGAE